MGADGNEAYADAMKALGEWIRDAPADGAAPAPRSMDALRLDAIDAAAKRSGLTRSHFLASAARDKIAATG
jgi:hypothetical protein